MNAQIWICLVLAAWPGAFGFYYEKVKDVFRPPTNLRNDSYFGYSIAYDSYYQKLVISAPRADNMGFVYDCDITSTSCSKINSTNIIRPTGDGLEKYPHDFWLGATVKAGPDFVMMCAPRYTEYTHRIKVKNGKGGDIEMGFNDIATRGRCYKHSKGSLTGTRIVKDEDRLKDSPGPREATMDSFGWSIDVGSDDSVIVGGPGMFHGRAMIYNRLEDYIVPYLIRKDINTPEFNFGYAVAIGTFLHDKQLSYAVSSTYGKFGSGEVSFYKKRPSVYQYIHKLETIDPLSKKVLSPVVGSMFGAVLCAAKMLGKRTDLLVGAPTYATKEPVTFNRGAVYVYLSRKRGSKIVLEYHRIITGELPGSMFGSAIISVGDLNKDDKDEIAVSAPFENSGQGVVYLYSGADIISTDSLKPLQKIKPEASYGESFGMSLTPLLDYDKNGCKEIAIGSPYTDTVVVLRCMASVLVKTSATFPNLQGRTKSGKENFEFNVFLSVEYPTLPDKISAIIKTTVEMDHEYAKLAESTGRFIFETNLHDKQREYCKQVPFILPKDGKYDMEIAYVISSALTIDPRNLTEFDSSRVLLSDLSHLNIRGALWAAECADKTCVPNLKLTADISFKNDSYPYIIGSSLTETLRFTLDNSGEVAYASCVRLHIDGVNVLQPGGCEYESSTDGSRLKCELPKPLWNGQNMTSGVIELEMVHLTNENKWINITMLLYNRCNDVLTQNQTYQIPVKADPSGIVVKGETDIGAIVGMKEEEIKEQGKKLRHQYTIVNNGPTNWMTLLVHVTLPLQPYINYFNNDNSSVIVISSISTENNSPCKYEAEDGTSMYFTCTVVSLPKNLETATILIPINILPGTLDGLLNDDKNITLTSSVKIELLDGKFKAESVFTTVTLKKASVPLDTIIIAVVVGLCILIIIALILYRIGFLRRKRREELQNLRKSVKRQTIMRRSTMPSQNNAADDRRQILDEMKEEDENDPAPNLPTK